MLKLRKRDNVEEKNTHKEKIKSSASIDYLKEYDEILNDKKVKARLSTADSSGKELAVTQLIDIDDETEINNIGIASHIGTRPSQQDSVIIGIGSNISPEFSGKFIAAVCDGMGGLQGGEIASSVCAKTFYEDFFSLKEIPDYPAFLKKEINTIDKNVAKLKNKGGESLNAGSTFVSIIIDKGNLYWGAVGDSHLYIVRGEEIVQVNRDHNYMLILNEQVKFGEITQEEANQNKQKDALISYMGMNGIKYMDVNEKPFILRKDDCIILCSDGLYRLLSNNEMLSILGLYPKNMGKAAQAMIDAACEKKKPHQDNTSVIIFKYM